MQATSGFIDFILFSSLLKSKGLRHFDRKFENIENSSLPRKVKRLRWPYKFAIFILVTFKSVTKNKIAFIQNVKQLLILLH